MPLLALLDNGGRAVWGDNAPALLLLGVAFCALRNGTSFGLAVGTLAGLWMETFGTGRMGGFLLLSGLTSGISGSISSRLFADSPLIRLALPFFVCVIQTAGRAFSWQAFLWTALAAQVLFHRLRADAQSR